MATVTFRYTSGRTMALDPQQQGASGSQLSVPACHPPGIAEPIKALDFPQRDSGHHPTRADAGYLTGQPSPEAPAKSNRRKFYFSG
jgi:hypothetical protein